MRVTSAVISEPKEPVLVTVMTSGYAFRVGLAWFVFSQKVIETTVAVVA